jgi:hypothetical protein
MQVKLDASFKALYGLLWKAAFSVIGGVVFFLVLTWANLLEQSSFESNQDRGFPC